MEFEPSGLENNKTCAFYLGCLKKLTACGPMNVANGNQSPSNAWCLSLSVAPPPAPRTDWGRSAELRFENTVSPQTESFRKAI